MLHWDVNNGVARRAWARNTGAMAAIERAMDEDERLKITMPETVEPSLLDALRGEIE